MKFSANLGFLWVDRPLPDAIRAAKAAGFDAVECHWPYNVPVSATAAALEETGLRMLGLNTSRGNVAIGENGLAALPGRKADARVAIDEAVAYAQVFQPVPFMSWPAIQRGRELAEHSAIISHMLAKRRETK